MRASFEPIDLWLRPSPTKASSSRRREASLSSSFRRSVSRSWLFHSWDSLFSASASRRSDSQIWLLRRSWRRLTFSARNELNESRSSTNFGVYDRCLDQCSWKYLET